jgi:hypothetical protein
MSWLRREIDVTTSDFIAPEDIDKFESRRNSLFSILADVPTFAYEQAEGALTAEQNAVLFSLLRSAQGPTFSTGSIYADEWAFLQSRSVLLSKLRKPLEAFRDAGSVVLEFGRAAGHMLIRQVIPAEHVPPVLTPGFMARTTAKWIILGGATVGGGTLGGVVGAAIGGPAGVITGKVVGMGAGKLASAALLAIDP